MRIPESLRLKYSLGNTPIGTTSDIPKLLRIDSGSKDLVYLVFPANSRFAQVAQNAKETWILVIYFQNLSNHHLRIMNLIRYYVRTLHGAKWPWPLMAILLREKFVHSTGSNSRYWGDGWTDSENRLREFMSLLRSEQIEKSWVIWKH